MKPTPLRTPFEPVESPANPPLNRRQAAKARTRERVMAAARELFMAQGYEGATIRDIARHAGMSTGAVFASFSDKADLFEAVFGHDVEILAQAFRDGAGRAGDVLARLSAMAELGYDQTWDSRAMMAVAAARDWTTPAEDDARARARSRAFIGLIAEVLRDGVRTGEIGDRGDLRLTAETLWDLFIAGYGHALREKADAAQTADRLAAQARLVVTGLKAA